VGRASAKLRVELTTGCPRCDAARTLEAVCPAHGRKHEKQPLGDVWHRRPSYPNAISGFDIFTTVLEDRVRTPAQFEQWLATHGLPTT